MDRLLSRTAPLRPLVLLVEGHEETRAMYALALSVNGFDVTVAPDGVDAYARAWEIHPDIIVADLPSAHRDGWAFLHRLKADARTRDIPVVGVIGQPSPREAADREAFASCFPNPCPPYELAAVLRAVLKDQG